MNGFSERIKGKIARTRAEFRARLDDEWPKRYLWAYRRKVENEDLRFSRSPGQSHGVFHDLNGGVLDTEGHLGNLLRDGYSVVSNQLFSPEWIESMDGALRELVARSEKEELPSAGIFDGRFGVDRNLIPTGIQRFYHPEKNMPGAEDFSKHEFLHYVGEQYLNRKLNLETTIAQYNQVSNPACRGYHIDSWVQQFKAFVYLVDVTEENGPFVYVKRSHLTSRDRVRKMFYGYKSQFDKSRDYGDVTGYTDEEVDASGLESVRLTGPRGTVILADTRGIHQGADLRASTRTALVNYYYP